MPLLSTGMAVGGMAAAAIPDCIGQGYNSILKTGSWVVSGVAEYIKYSDDNWKKLKLELDRYLNFERDPGKALWLTNMLLRPENVALPPNMSQEEWGFLKSLWNNIKRGDGDASRDLIYAEKLTKANLADQLKGEIPLAEEYYTAWTSPYSSSKSAGKDPISITQHVMSAIDAEVGYRQWAGFAPGSNHMWSLMLEPYGTYCPEFPTYKLPAIFSSSGAEFSFGHNCPAVSYQLAFGNQSTKTISLYNSSQIHVPMGFSYEMMMDVSIVDDTHGSMHQYMNKYLNNAFDISTASAYTYKEISMLLKLVVWKDGYVPKHEFQFIVVPYNYTPVLNGEQEASAEMLNISFSVVGMKGMTKGRSINLAPNSTGDFANTSWTQVTLVPNAPEYESATKKLF